MLAYADSLLFLSYIADLKGGKGSQRPVHSPEEPAQAECDRRARVWLRLDPIS